MSPSVYHAPLLHYLKAEVSKRESQAWLFWKQAKNYKQIKSIFSHVLDTEF